MINFRELRCGNIIRKRDGIFVIDQNNILTIARNPIPYSPLEISEEILLKVGFDVAEDSGDSKAFSIKGFDFYVGIDHEDLRFDYVTKSGFYCVFYDDVRLQHLHQLQNIYFALTGQELNVSKLF